MEGESSGRPDADNINAHDMSSSADNGSSDDDTNWETIDRHINERASHEFAFRPAVNFVPINQVDPLAPPLSYFEHFCNCTPDIANGRDLITTYETNRYAQVFVQAHLNLTLHSRVRA